MNFVSHIIGQKSSNFDKRSVGLLSLGADLEVTCAPVCGSYLHTLVSDFYVLRRQLNPMSPSICMLLSADNGFGYNTDWFNGNAKIWLLANSLISFFSNFLLLFFFSCLFLFLSPFFLSLSFFLLFLCPLHVFFFPLHAFSLSLAWNGDWKPPKVWRNCKSQKQPAQQPCKSTRNFLWGGNERKKEALCSACNVLKH